MAAKKFEQAIADIATFLGEQPGPHDLDEIKAATDVSGQMAGKVLAALVDAKTVVLERTDGVKRWAWIPARQAEPADDGTSAAEDLVEEASGEDGEAPGVFDEPTAEDRPDLTSPVPLDPDPMVMLVARVLADASTPMGTDEVTEAAFMPAKSREVLTALRALTERGMATCSMPFAPDNEDCEWQRIPDLDYIELMYRARAVEMGDAPDAVTCPTCGTVKPIAGVTKSRKRGSHLRADGSRKLPPGGLKRLTKEWLAKPENAGEEVTPGQLKKKLRAEHGDLIGHKSDGALRQLMADKFTEPDPTDHDKRPLLVLVNESPITYRIRESR